MPFQDSPLFRELEKRVDWERTKMPQTEYKLDRMRAYAQRAGNPQHAVPSYHIAGSKGKGSTAYYLAQLLEGLGYKTGLYTSPHLNAWSERITRSGEFWPQAAYQRALEEALGLATEGETVFEILTLTAWLLFRNQGCQRAVLETGLGGRLDATNLVAPIRSVLTRIEFEHTDILGDTLEQIAREKAGIIKPEVPAWTYEQRPEVQRVFEQVAHQQQSPLRVLEEGYQLSITSVKEGQHIILKTGERIFEWTQPTLGPSLARNAALALAVVLDAEQPSGQQLHQALRRMANSRLEGRLEFHPGEPDLVLDGAHTQESVQQLVRVLKERWNSGVLVVAFNNDKKILEMAQTLSSLGWPLVVTQSPHPKALEAERLAQVFKGQVWVEPDFQEAYRKALALCPIQGVVVAAGSFFLVGALRAALGLC